MKNRTVIGIICMVLAAAVMFGVAPVVNRLTSDTTTVIRLSSDVKQGSQITDGQIETVEVKTNTLPAGVVTQTSSGCFDSDFWSRDSELLNQYYYYDINTSAEKYYNSTYRRVQLGDTMTVKIDVRTYVKGLGVFKIPVTVSVTRSGISEKYWK